MAYYAANEKQTELCKLKKNDRGEYIRVCDIQNKKSGDNYADIRTMYTDKSGEVRPTTKGVRLPKELVGDIVVALLECLTAEEKVQIEDDICRLMGLEIEY